MSLRSRREILNEAAAAKDASNEAVLMAALNESQEEYKRLSAQYLQEITRLKAEIEAARTFIEDSNKKEVVDIQAALQTALEAILGDMRGAVAAYITEIKTATAKLQAANQEKVENDKWENIKWMTILFVSVVTAFAVGGYIANYAWGYWYDVPETLDKLDAINNGVYQLLNRP